MAGQNNPSAPQKLDTPAARGANWLRRAVAAVIDAVYSPTARGKVAQGATELSNALYNGPGGGHAYSPYTAENAAHRAQFQSKATSRGMER